MKEILSIKPAGASKALRKGSAGRCLQGGVEHIKLTSMDHNTFYRLKSIADHLTEKFRDTSYSLLDVGGGDGSLRLFLPQASYVIADPRINGISGTELPFGDKSFDAVVACHVLEHIGRQQRIKFLDQLCSKAKRYVILLNPFQYKEKPTRESLDLFISVENSDWAKEHKRCAEPAMEEIENYARSRGIKLAYKPNGTLAAAMAVEFMNYFAKIAGRKYQADMINEFFNTALYKTLDSDMYPNGYLVEFDLSEPE
ncbi:class I SAM-dependent methyltransferase [Candidatus Omnitrophota bacterium]